MEKSHLGNLSLLPPPLLPPTHASSGGTSRWRDDLFFVCVILTKGSSTVLVWKWQETYVKNLSRSTRSAFCFLSTFKKVEAVASFDSQSNACGLKLQLTHLFSPFLVMFSGKMKPAYWLCDRPRGGGGGCGGPTAVRLEAANHRPACFLSTVEFI